MSAHRSTVPGFSACVKCCRSSVRRLRHHAWNDVRGGWWYRSPVPESDTGGPLKPTCFLAWSHTNVGTAAARSRASSRFCGDNRRKLGFILYQIQPKQSNTMRIIIGYTPVKTWQIANGIVDRNVAERCDARFGVHCPRDIAIRETDFEAVRRREVVRWFWCGQEWVSAPRCEEEETHACLRGAVVRCLEQAKAHLVARGGVAAQ